MTSLGQVPFTHRTNMFCLAEGRPIPRFMAIRLCILYNAGCAASGSELCRPIRMFDKRGYQASHRLDRHNQMNCLDAPRKQEVRHHSKHTCTSLHLLLYICAYFEHLMLCIVHVK